ncbi:hypothetical protein CLPUN_40590 [Clostridium puniceum]|uniref:Uncharacterized protein n=1 Tax=Clostridium puniceum TaxID=29367 RepID=A0A1S8T9S9_9CLOT|nr:hypothetical protein CLPUN_40590 [Clostridium puniceum]
MIAATILIINTIFSTYQIILGVQNQMKYDGGNIAAIIRTSVENIDNVSKTIYC